MTDILTALKECGENKGAMLTCDECIRALNLIQILNGRYESAQDTIKQMDSDLSAARALIPKKDSPTVNAIKWAGRWLAAIVAGLSLALILATWQNVPLYWVCLATVVTIYTHGLGMLFEWWHK